jgi:hypothetical protein
MKKALVFLVMFLLLAVSVNATIKVTMLNQDPDPVTAGDVVKVRFKIENTGQTTPEDVLISIVEDTPFTIYDKDKERNLGRMLGFTKNRDASIIDFRILVDRNANDGQNELKLKVQTGGTIVYHRDEFYVDVDNEAINLRLYIRDSNIITHNNKGKVTIGIANGGDYDIKYLGLTVLPSDDYVLLSKSAYSYIGNLDPDDTESEDIEIFVPEEVEEVRIPIHIEYEVNDVLREMNTVLTLNLLSDKDAKEIGLIEGTNYLPVILIIIVVALFFIWRYMKKKK